MASGGPVGLLDLPFEIRSKILSYLLPDTRFIVHEAKTDGFKRFGDRFVPDHRLGLAPVPHWWTFDYKTVSPYPEVLLTNRQLYADGFCQLYELQSFKLVVNYLEYDFLGVTYYHFDGLLPPLPYHAMKEFVIEVWGYSTISTLALRRKLAGLLALFREN